MNFESCLKNYATLAVRTGVNLQPGQELLLMSPVDCAPFARLIAEEAYRAGARDVTIHYSDEKFQKIRFQHAALEVFETVPAWLADSRNSYAEQGAAVLQIAAGDPEIFSDVDSQKQAVNTRALFKAYKSFHNILDVNGVQWSIISAPTKPWARKVFPDCEEQEAVRRLWEAIFRAVRADLPDPEEAWKEHGRQLKKRRDWLNMQQFDSLHFYNGSGTDIVLGLPRKHVWGGGSQTTRSGVGFFPNLPTEEVFCLPHRERVDGVVTGSLPLNYEGTLIEDFSLMFENGYVLDYTAKKGFEALRRLIHVDDGSYRLGEVALVPSCSPISDMGTLFYNTLFDENASCHLALGRAYASCLQGGTAMSKQQLVRAGANDSLVHVDFMIGTADMTVVGIDQLGNEICVFENGNWAAQLR